jgi:hypothetical protein
VQFEQINSLYSNRVAKNDALPSPLKKEMKSQPVHTNNICITAGVNELGIGARSGSSAKALMRACIFRYLFSSDVQLHHNFKGSTIGKPM